VARDPGRPLVGLSGAGLGDLPPRPAGARTFSQPRTPGFADCAPSGRMRLDALACWLQDVAYADVEDAGLADVAVWVVRRTRIRVNRFPRFGERFSLTTFCSGLGRMWAERGTDVLREGETVPDVQASSLWVHLDVERWVPTPLTQAEVDKYSGLEKAPRVSARLRHPVPAPERSAAVGAANAAPSGVAAGRPWTFRAAECDIADHVNNAAYWTPLEEELLAGPDRDGIDVEIEYRAPAQPGDKRVLSAGDRRWIVSGDGELHASFLLAVVA
jgi:acyl-ACP thioesterase